MVKKRKKSITELIKERQDYFYDNVNREIEELQAKGKIVSMKKRSKIYSKWHKRANKKFK